MDLKKSILLKKINHSQLLKLQQDKKMSQIYITGGGGGGGGGGFKKVAHIVRNSELLSIWSKKL